MLIALARHARGCVALSALLVAFASSSAAQTKAAKAGNSDKGLAEILKVHRLLCSSDKKDHEIQSYLLENQWENYGDGAGTDNTVFAYLREKPEAPILHGSNFGLTTGVKTIEGLNAIFVLRDLSIDQSRTRECSMIITALAVPPKTTTLDAYIGSRAHSPYSLGLNREGDRLWIWTKPDDPNLITVGRWAERGAGDGAKAGVSDGHQFSISTIRTKESTVRITPGF